MQDSFSLFKFGTKYVIDTPACIFSLILKCPMAETHPILQLRKKMRTNQSDNTAGWVFTLHTTNPGLIPGTSYGAPTPSGVAPKQTTTK